MTDRTLIAVSRQVKAMGQPAYDIGLKSEETQLMMNRTWTAEEIVSPKNLNWLKHMNKQGRHIYIRPAAENHNLVLIDDLNQAQIAKLSQDNLAPAATVETSPYNFQAWIKLSNEAVTPDKRSWIAQRFAERFNADPNSADFRHYGRLAGFTNPKPEHRQENGYQPFVLLDSSTGATARDGHLWVTRAAEHLQNHSPQTLQAAKIEAQQHFHQNQQHIYNDKDPDATYRTMAGKIMKRYGKETDLSIMDFMIAKSMAAQGKFSKEQVMKAMLKESPNLYERKASSTGGYVIHTVQKAFSQMGKAPEPSEGNSVQKTTVRVGRAR